MGLGMLARGSSRSPKGSPSTSSDRSAGVRPGESGTRPDPRPPGTRARREALKERENLRTEGRAHFEKKLAEGGMDVYPRFGPTSEWDTAADRLKVAEYVARFLRDAGARDLDS